jgi:SPP1 gp7 family putative phage head morphogenesis protein
MTFQEAQISTFFETEKEVDPYIQIMLKNYKTAEAAIVQKMKDIYAKYLAGIKPEDWYNTVIQYNRLEGLLTQAQSIYRDYASLANKDTAGIMKTAIANTYYRQQYLLNWVKGDIDLSFSIIDPRLVDMSVYGTIDSWKAITKSLKDKYDMTAFQPARGSLSDLLMKHQDADLVKIQQTITQSFIMGSSIDDAASAISDVLGTSAFNAERVVRTEFTRLSNAGDYAAAQDAEAQGLNLTRRWIATLDDRTRQEHAELDGQIVGMDEPFEVAGYDPMFPGDFGDPAQDCQCRCTVETIVDGDSAELRRAVNPETGESEVIEWSSFKDWADSNGLTENKYGQLY